MKNIKNIWMFVLITCLVITATVAMSSCEKESQPVHQHSLTEVPEVAASCSEAGTKTYYLCSDCGKLFADPEGETEIDTPETIEKLEHADTLLLYVYLFPFLFLYTCLNKMLSCFPKI